ncbi:MAG TPA: 2'-5' RNA ligase family protein [Bryobacteraceae bacterium]|jgi:2'-5' RNA ligase|nr:2'-5' RNA ligase family protein [Bryobacteraceae bacterium]
MGPDSTELSARIPPEERLNIFALVIYIPDPLGRFLDELRRRLVPGCNPHAHVSLLPPRPLAVEWPVASEQVHTILKSRTPFEVELTVVEAFPVTDVIYLGVGDGASELRQVHKAMNSAALDFQEPFAYHPHVTLAQELPRDRVAATRELADRLWREYTGPRHFSADHAAFVQNSLGNCWIDLAEYSLGGSVVKS